MKKKPVFRLTGVRNKYWVEGEPGVKNHWCLIESIILRLVQAGLWEEACEWAEKAYQIASWKNKGRLHIMQAQLRLAERYVDLT